jgi:DNA-binding NarL/FixJ family response regulator
MARRAARSWFPRGPIDENPPNWVVATLARARAVTEERDRGAACVRLRTRSGRWLVCHASTLRDADGAIEASALVIEPAQAAEVAPIVAEAHELSRREKEVAQLLAHGASTADIARELFISTHTVRDYVKAIFAKVGVSSRCELVAKLFAEHYAPLHMAPDNVVVVRREAA